MSKRTASRACLPALALALTVASAAHAQAPPPAAPDPTPPAPASAPPPAPAPAPKPAPTPPSETNLILELRLDGFYGTSSGGRTTNEAVLVGAQAGGIRWFGGSPFGWLATLGAEIGCLKNPFDGTIVGSLEMGPQFNIVGSRQRGAILGLTWTPRLFVNMVSNEVFVPAAAELSLRVWRVKIPVWVARMLDGTSFVGGAVAFIL